MSLVSGGPVSRRHIASISAVFALVLMGVLAFAARAQAAETLLWDNYGATPESIAYANTDGSGGGVLNIVGSVISNPEGMAYDTVTNRLFVANEGGATDGQVTFINLDGSGAGVFTAPGAPVEEPEGIAIDPATRMIFWLNTQGTDKISWAKLDGSAGGVLNTTGATLEGAYRIAVDPVAGRVYWGNTAGSEASISYANVNNTGGGNLDITGATPTTDISGVVADPAGGRVYWLNNDLKTVSFASTAGAGGGDLNTIGATYEGPYGLAFDPALGKFYWGNYGNDESRTNAIGVGLLSGGGGGITPLTAPVDGPQDPVILKSPTATGSPGITRSTTAPSQLTCSTGTWAADLAGSFVYQAPRTFAYQWTNNGAPVAGGTAATLAATTVGSYACTVTAANQAGTGTQASAPVNVKAAKVKLTTKKKARVKAGGVATFKVKAVNQGDLKSKNARVCVKLPKKAKKVLKAPKCKAIGKVAALGKDSAKLRIKVGKDAVGTYKVTFQVRGNAGKSAKSKIIVAAPKK